MCRPEEIPVFLLCGGLGTRLREQTDLRPKPMIEVGGKPILWHIMRSYAHHGFRRFVLCLGYKSEVVKPYFLNYASMNSDFSVRCLDGSTYRALRDHGDNWEVTLAYTGELAMTGSCASAPRNTSATPNIFASPTATALTDADLPPELAFHRHTIDRHRAWHQSTLPIRPAHSDGDRVQRLSGEARFRRGVGQRRLLPLPPGLSCRT